jgi:uncharacterized protein (DUF58 family)
VTALLRGATPTARAAAILGVIALAVLVVPVAIAAGAALVLLAACVTDAWAVRRPPAIDRRLDRGLSRGVTVPVRVHAAAPDGRRVLLRQPATAALAVEQSTGAEELVARLTPGRRGRHQLPAVASASVGGLGLARVHHPSGEPVALRVYPDLVAARALIARLRRELAGHPGRIARGPLGLGTDFESVREYSPDDDIRQLNWRATARMGRPMSNQYRLERDRDVVCLLDVGRLMAAPIGELTMLDAALDAVALLALAADELGDRCGAIAFDSEIRRVIAPRHLSGRRVIEGLFDVQPRLVDSDFELACVRVGRSRRALVVIFTDLVDDAAARSLIEAVPMLTRRHTVTVVSAADPALAATAAGAGGGEERGRALVAADVLETRAATAARLRRLGASVIEAPAAELAAGCLNGYLEAKARARL